MPINITFTLPLFFEAMSDQPEFLVRDIEEQVTKELVVETDSAKSVDDTMSAFLRPTEEMAQHLKATLYARYES